MNIECFGNETKWKWKKIKIKHKFIIYYKILSIKSAQIKNKWGGTNWGRNKKLFILKMLLLIWNKSIESR